jgi:hypothetical protein
MSEASTARRRHWSDIVALVAGLWAIAESIWGPAISAQNVVDASVGYTWLVFATAGALAVAAVFLAQRMPALARLALAAAGLLLLIVPLIYEREHALPMATGLILAVAMLASTPFIGRIGRELPPHSAGLGRT